jgi:hypothetical protein
VILLLLFAALLIAMVLREPIPAVTGIANGAVNLFLNVLPRVAFAVFVSFLLLVVRSIVLGRHHDSR